MTAPVLVVDDDVNLLSGLRRLLRGKVDARFVEGGEQALESLERDGPPAVILCDMRMRGLDGIETLRQFRERAPDTVRLMLTGNADMQTAIDAINDGAIFRFLTKPCPPEILEACLSAALRQHQLVMAERELLEQTLAGSVKVLTDMMAMAAPQAFARSAQILDWVRRLTRELRVQRFWRLELAAMLAPLGLLSLPPETLTKVELGLPLDPMEEDMLESAPAAAAGIIGNIPRLDKVARFVLLQNRGMDGAGAPGDGPPGTELPLEARILKVLNDLWTLTRGRLPVAADFARLDEHKARYDPAVLKHVRACLEQPERPRFLPRRTVTVRVADLRPGMMVAEGVRLAPSAGAEPGSQGRLLLAETLRLSHAHLEIVRNLVQFGRLPDAFTIYDEEEDDREVPAEDAIAAS